MNVPGPHPPSSLFSGGGQMGELIRSMDWSTTPLGPIEDWPPSLRTAVSLCLASTFPIDILWGPEAIQIYNDGYWPICGDKHPRSMGQGFRECWESAWDVIGPPFEDARRGGTGFLVNERIFLDRNGYLEETFFTFSLSPIRDETGAIGGLFHPVIEETQQVLGERRLTALRTVADRTADVRSVAEACSVVIEALDEHALDVPFALLYLLDGATATLAAASGSVPAAAAPARVGLAAPDAEWPLGAAARERAVLEVDVREHRFDCPYPESPRAAVVLPITLSGLDDTFAVLVAGVSPRRELDEPYHRYFLMLRESVTNALTNARAYEQESRRAEALAELDRAKTEFFTGVSHELRTPLTLIAGPAEDGLADTAEPLPPGQRARMELIARNGGRLRRLVDTFLEFARLEDGALAPEKVPVDLAALTRGIGESFAPAITRAGLEFLIDCPALGGPDIDGSGRDAAVSVDVDMWEKIVLNLLSNAVKFTTAGRIELALCLATDQDGGVELRVSDTGIGIPVEEQSKLFRRFHRVRGAAGRSHEGSGIGLALVAELAGLHEGTATVHSTPGRGSTFVVTLPATARTTALPGPSAASATVGLYREEALQWSHDSTSDQEPAAPRADRLVEGVAVGGAPGARVLVAEDNTDLRRFVAGLLEPHYTVLLAADGSTALDRARVERPDLVLTDVMMPGLDGFELLAALRADPATAAIPVIVLSARAGTEAVGEGLAAGADDYLIKPFSSVDLLARVRSNLAMARLRSTEGAWRTGLLNALRDALVVVDAAGRVVEINDAFADVLGYGPEGLPYTAPWPWWPDPVTDPDDHAQVVDALAEAQNSGGGRFLLPQRHRDGRHLWVEASASTIADPHGDGPMLVGVFRDVTAARRAEQRDRLLVEVGRVLARPGGLVDRLAELTALAAPVLADMAVVSLVRPDGRYGPVAAAHHRDPAAAAAVLDLAPHVIPEALRQDYESGRVFVLGEVTEQLLAEAAADEPDLAARRRLAFASTLIVPLVVAGRALGSLTFSSTAVARSYDAADLALAEELGRRVGGAVDADRVATRERQLHTATTALAEAATLAEAADALADVVIATTEATGIAIFAVRPDDPDLHVIHTVGYPDEVAAAFTRIPAAADLPVAHAARTRNAVWLGDRHSRRARYPHMAVGSAADGVHAVAALPLLVGDRVVGVIAASFPTARAFPADERSFAMTLAGQAATAFDRAAITDAHARIAQTLQRSLLPARLPTHPRLALAAHYEPAGEHTQAGGDWYDVITLDEHRVAIVVGDVVGNGPAAAAVMGQLRSALAGFLLESHSPAHALTWLSRFARRVDGALGSTAICVVLHTDTGELRWARAGHPPPLLLDPAADPDVRPTARYLDDAHGVVLGIAEPIPYTEGRVVVAPGASVLLYTDGLVERRGEVIDDGLDRLIAAAATRSDQTPDALITALRRAGLDDGRPADDVALIIARLLPAPLHQHVPAAARQLPALRRSVGRWAAAAGLSAEHTEDLHLALGEAAANAVEHAYRDHHPDDDPPEFSYRLDRDPHGAVHVQVRDQGTWRPAPADPGYRGRGLAMIRSLSTDVELRTTGPGTHLRFTLPEPHLGTPADHAPGDGPVPDEARHNAHHVVVPAGIRPDPRPDGALDLHLSGDIDLGSLPGLRHELLDRIRRAPGEVTIEIGEVTYLASAGVGLLIEAFDLAPGRVRIVVHPDSPPARVLTLTGLDRQLFTVSPLTQEPDHVR